MGRRITVSDVLFTPLAWVVVSLGNRAAAWHERRNGHAGWFQ